MKDSEQAVPITHSLSPHLPTHSLKTLTPSWDIVSPPIFHSLLLGKSLRLGNSEPILSSAHNYEVTPRLIALPSLRVMAGPSCCQITTSLRNTSKRNDELYSEDSKGHVEKAKSIHSWHFLEVTSWETKSRVSARRAGVREDGSRGCVGHGALLLPRVHAPCGTAIFTCKTIPLPSPSLRVRPRLVFPSGASLIAELIQMFRFNDAWYQATREHKDFFG